LVTVLDCTVTVMRALCTAAPAGSADANDWTLVDPLPTVASPLESHRRFSLDDVDDGALARSPVDHQQL